MNAIFISSVRGLIVPVFCFIALLSSFSMEAQPLGIQLNTPEATSAYLLFTHQIPSERIVLVDNCGEIVHQWNPNNEFTRYHPKLIPNGNLLYITSESKIIELDWDGRLVKNTVLSGHRMPKYEVILLENGNYLSIGRRSTTNEEALALGFPHNYGQYDIVMEVEPETGTIIWEWDITDHMLQERDPEIANYGIAADHPELLNMDAISDFDWTRGESFMINGMDYNADLDQIVLSIRKMSEFIIIDHSTTTVEAASSAGGTQGKGGDILYRWGNPQNYGRGDSLDQQLFHQHNPNWVTEGPHKDKIIVYNNGLSRPVPEASQRYSSIEIVDTRVNDTGGYHLEENTAFKPDTAEVRYNKNTVQGLDFYSSYFSGATVLENGHIHISIGNLDNPQVFEINSSGELVWAYNIFGIGTFRTVKYPHDYVAFDGRDLTPQGTLESPSSDYVCDLSTTSTFDPTIAEDISVVHLPGSNQLSIHNMNTTKEIALYNIMGQKICSYSIEIGRQYFQLPPIHSGIYIAHILSYKTNASYSHKIYIQ